MCKFFDVVLAACFVHRDNDHVIFIHTSSSGRTIFLLCGDEMIIIGGDLNCIDNVKRCHQKCFKIDLARLHYFLSFEVTYS